MPQFLHCREARGLCAADLNEFHRPRANINLPVKPAGLYGPAVCCKPDVMNGNVWSCASVSGP